MKNIFEQCYTHIKEYEDIKQGVPFTKEQDETVAELLKDKAGRIHAIDRLAELEDKIDEFICSECGLILEEYHEKRIDDDGDEIYYEYEIKYCPSCGAKVVEE